MIDKNNRDSVAKVFALLTRDGAIKSLMSRLPAIVSIELPGGPVNDVYVSPQIEKILGYTPDEWLAGPSLWIERIHPDDRDRVVAAAQHSSDTGMRFHMEYRLLAKDGSVVWVAEDDSCVFDDDGDQLYWQGVTLDVTNLKQAESQLRISESQFQSLAEHIPAVLYIDPPDMGAHTIYVSPRIADILGVSPEEYVSDPGYWWDHVHPEDRERAQAEYDEFCATGKPESSSYRMLKPDGSVVWILDRATMIRDENGEPLMLQGVMFDLTEQKKAEEQIAYMAHHDRLTGLPNRPMFEEMLDLSLARARRSNAAVGVLLLDLDDFKLLNNSLGHAAGDELLRQLAPRLRKATRDTDMVARQGGDEFLILLADIEGNSTLPGPDMDAALLATESTIARIQRALGEPFAVADTEVYVTASVGVSFFPGHATDTHTLLKHADSAMYLSKKAGPGGYSIYSTDVGDSTSRLTFSTRLRKAVESQHWVLHYQPIVDLIEARMVGVEALLRWQDPNSGMIPPGEFISLAEEMGLIEAIGEWVIEEVCRQASNWEDQGVDLEIGFNLSPRQLWQPNLADHIFSNVENARLDPSRFVLEITEGAAMIDPERTQHILWDLHGRGLHLAIDDFGTGYSSLSRLKHLPVSTLKIDRTFVMDIPGDPDAGSMVNAVVQLANGLGMTPLAEGIETEAQWRFLVEKGCRMGQGYFFSRPVPAHEITAIAKGFPLRMADDVTPA